MAEPMRFNPMIPGARPFDSFLSQQMPMGTSAIRRQIGGGTPPSAFRGLGQRPPLPPVPRMPNSGMPPRGIGPIPPGMPGPVGPSPMPVMSAPPPMSAPPMMSAPPPMMPAPAMAKATGGVMDLYLS